MSGNQVLVFQNEVFQLNVPSECRGMMENAMILMSFMYPKRMLVHQGLMGWR